MIVDCTIVAVEVLSVGTFCTTVEYGGVGGTGVFICLKRLKRCNR
ncbi:MAG: hypothetical protein VX930_13580 [Pseudomonadota bacterium]|nr:hypothetical protein [Pseudomonadota bacterium]